MENQSAPVRRVFYAAATAQSSMYAIDYVSENADGQLVSKTHGKTQAELSQEHGCEVLIADLDAYALIQENLYKTEPRQITEDEFIQALEVLPPLQWCRHQGVEYRPEAVANDRRHRPELLRRLAQKNGRTGKIISASGGVATMEFDDGDRELGTQSCILREDLPMYLL